MKINTYFFRLADTYILGPSVSLEEGQIRAGMCLIGFEIGIAFDSEKVHSYGCSGCSSIGYAVLDELPPGWKKCYRPDKTYYFLCTKCQTPEFEAQEDYMLTEDNRGHAVDEIISDLKDENSSAADVKALRDYANRLLDETDNWGKEELQSSLAAYSDGFQEALKLKRGDNQ